MTWLGVVSMQIKLYRWCIIEFYTWNLQNFINGVTPKTSIKNWGRLPGSSNYSRTCLSSKVTSKWVLKRNTFLRERPTRGQPFSFCAEQTGRLTGLDFQLMWEEHKVQYFLKSNTDSFSEKVIVKNYWWISLLDSRI